MAARLAVRKAAVQSAANAGPSRKERARVRAENRKAFKMAGVDINKTDPLTKDEVDRVNKALMKIRTGK